MGCFRRLSLHPLKNINVWSDGGIVTTDNYKIYKKISPLRNHGLVSRDKVEICGYNSRLDTVQAVVGNWLLPKAKSIAKKNKNANYLDQDYLKLKEFIFPKTKQLQNRLSFI